MGTLRPRIGISACLLGAPVRYDGTDKRPAFPLPELMGRVEWVPVCPEVEMGMPVPREPVRLEAGPAGVRMRGLLSREDHTERMAAWANRRLARLSDLGLSGYVLKANSPSCGIATVPLLDAAGAPFGTTTGLFTAALCAAFPDLPVEDEVRLLDDAVREAFVRRVLAAALPR